MQLDIAVRIKPSNLGFQKPAKSDRILGNALELITIEEEERNLLIVIHAMRLRKQYMYLLEGDL